MSAEFYRSGTPSVQFPNIKESPNTEHTYNNTGNAGKDRIVLAWQWRVLPFAGLIPIIMYLVDSIYRMAHPIQRTVLSHRNYFLFFNHGLSSAYICSLSTNPPIGEALADNALEGFGCAV